MIQKGGLLWLKVKVHKLNHVEILELITFFKVLILRF